MRANYVTIKAAAGSGPSENGHAAGMGRGASRRSCQPGNNMHVPQQAAHKAPKHATILDIIIGQTPVYIRRL